MISIKNFTIRIRSVSEYLFGGSLSSLTTTYYIVYNYILSSLTTTYYILYDYILHSLQLHTTFFTTTYLYLREPFLQISVSFFGPRKLYFNYSWIIGGLDGGVPNSVFNKKCRAYSWFDKWNITLIQYILAFLLNSVFDSSCYSLIVKK